MRKILGFVLALLLVPSIAFADEVDDLAEGLMIATKGMNTKLTLAKAKVHAAAALAAELETGISAEILLGMAYYESRYEYGTISRLVCTEVGDCKRKTGKVKSRKKPSNIRGRLFCGAIQMGTLSWKKCWYYIDHIDLAYLNGAKHLVEWLNDKRCKKKADYNRMVCAQKGYRTGNPHSKKIRPIRNRLQLAKKIERHTPKNAVGG